MEEELFEPDAYFVDVENLEPENFTWGARKFLLRGSAMPDAELTLSLVWIIPGEEDPLHVHPNAEQVMYVLEGEGELLIDDTMYHLVTGDVIRVPRNTPHQASNTGWEPLRFLVAFSSPNIETKMLESTT